MSLNTTEYFKKYRLELGFTSQNQLKKFFAGKDISPNIDFKYIESLDNRLLEIVNTINKIVHHSIQVNNTNLFYQNQIKPVSDQIKKNNLLPQLNNQGRRPEEVYFSWMRGYLILQYFLKAVSNIFEIDFKDIMQIGDDNFSEIKLFKRTPKADLEVKISGHYRVRLEIQSGFQGINDIKQHKVIEAKKIKNKNKISSILIHFDLFNGQVAFIDISSIEDNDIHWITRQQMEGQTVFNINQSEFIWRLIEEPPKYKDLFPL